MAVDEVLMAGVRNGGAPVLRMYRWSPACLSLGRNQPGRGEYREDLLASSGVDVVRRLTGGRAVLHDHELTYSVVVADGVLGSPRSAYAAINRGLVAGLRKLGVNAALQPRSRTHAAAPSLAPCFREPAEGEVVAGGAKLIGSAQFRDRGVILQHGSLLLSGDQRRISDFLASPAFRDDDPPAVLFDLLDPLPDWTRLVEALMGGLCDALGVELQADALSPPELQRTDRLTHRYRDPSWTWRG